MTVKNPKEAYLGPLGPLRHLLVLWFENIQNNGDSVLVVIPNDALIRISSV